MIPNLKGVGVMQEFYVSTSVADAMFLFASVGVIISDLLPSVYGPLTLIYATTP